MKQFLGKIVFLCALFSLLGLNVMPAPVAPMQPGISYGGRAVAIAVNPANADDILVASETGGLFRSKTHGGLWTQVSESSTFEFTDVAYFPADTNFVIATASPDPRLLSGDASGGSAQDG